MSARYTRRDGVKTAITALSVGIVAGALYALPPVVTVPVCCVALYLGGVLDGQATRRGGRVVVWCQKARTDTADSLREMVRRPAGGR
ncbi:hypothetical protein [Actinomadura atramentaria]|uniref:hypothetical protein n=1 Tax=Actinomadura atramentaria TaxID=1990 RepID=UPI00036896F8|nr:hypothetical protein [Actinomadura atramentaria]